MHGPINVKSPNNTSKWQMGFNSAFKGLIVHIERLRVRHLECASWHSLYCMICIALVTLTRGARDLNIEWDHAMWMPNMTLHKILIFSLVGSRDTMWPRKSKSIYFLSERAGDLTYILR